MLLKTLVLAMIAACPNDFQKQCKAESFSVDSKGVVEIKEIWKDCEDNSISVWDSSTYCSDGQKECLARDYERKAERLRREAEEDRKCKESKRAVQGAVDESKK